MVPLLLSLSLAAPAPPQEPTISGKYTLVSSSTGSGRGGGFPGSTTRREATISRTSIQVEGRAAIEYEIDTTAKPMTVELTVTSLRGKATKHKGIAESNGDRLLIAYAAEGAERPKTFEDADGVTVYVFQKAPPPVRFEYRILLLRQGAEEATERELNKLAADGFELVSTAAGSTATHLVLKRQKP